MTSFVDDVEQIDENSNSYRAFLRRWQRLHPSMYEACVAGEVLSSSRHVVDVNENLSVAQIAVMVRCSVDGEKVQRVQASVTSIRTRSGTTEVGFGLELERAQEGMFVQAVGFVASGPARLQATRLVVSEEALRPEARLTIPCAEVTSIGYSSGGQVANLRTPQGVVRAELPRGIWIAEHTYVRAIAWPSRETDRKKNSLRLSRIEPLDGKGLVVARRLLSKGSEKQE